MGQSEAGGRLLDALEQGTTPVATDEWFLPPDTIRAELAAVDEEIGDCAQQLPALNLALDPMLGPDSADTGL